MGKDELSFVEDERIAHYSRRYDLCIKHKKSITLWVKSNRNQMILLWWPPNQTVKSINQVKPYNWKWFSNKNHNFFRADFSTFVNLKTLQYLFVADCRVNSFMLFFCVFFCFENILIYLKFVRAKEIWKCAFIAVVWTYVNLHTLASILLNTACKRT